MKRYGFKFRQLNGENTKAIDLRYYPVIGGFIAIIFSSLIFPPGSIIFVVCLLHLALGFVAEVFPRFAFTLIVLVSLITTVLVLNFYIPEIGSCYENCRTDRWFKLQGKEQRILQPLQFAFYMAVLIGYHAIYIYAAKLVISSNTQLTNKGSG